MANTIVLDLTREDRATVFRTAERLQVDAYEKACNLLSSAEDFVKSLAKTKGRDDEWMDKFNQPLDRIHNTIFIDGARGSGKTAFMLNIESAYLESLVDDTNGLYFSQPIDPTLLNVKEDFINVIIGQIHGELERYYCRKRKDIQQGYFDALEQVTDALESEFTAKSSFGVDKLLAFKGSLELERRLFDYFEQAKIAFGSHAIVLLIDDVDMSLEVAFSVLEVIRKYLACPHILPVVSGDKKLYHTIVNRHFLKQLAVNTGLLSNKERVDAHQLATRYMQKIFPEHAEIQLRSFTDLRQEHTIKVKYKTYVLSFDQLYARLKKIIHAGTNGFEKSAPEFEPKTCRDLIQFLRNLMILSRQSDDTVALFKKGVSGRIRKLSRSKPLLTLFMDYFSARGEQKLQRMIQTSLKIFTFQKEDDVPLFLRDIGIFDIRNHHVVEGDYQDLIEYKGKSTKSEKNQFVEESIALLERVGLAVRESWSQGEFLQTLPQLMISFPAVEPYAERLKITKLHAENVTGGNDNFLLRLYTHNDFYSSHQTGYLLFFGKVFELVFSSIYQDLDEYDLDEMLDAAPFHSFFHYFSSKSIRSDDDEDVEDGPTEAVEDDEASADNDESLELLASKISKWREEHLGKVKYSAQFFYSVFNKYFSQIHTLKEQRHIQNESIWVLHQRVKYILLNAVGSFEKASDSVVRQNIAIGENFEVENIKSDSSFAKNISPLLENKRYLTSAIEQHPIFNLKVTDQFILTREGELIAQENRQERAERHRQIDISVEKDAVRSTNSEVARKALKVALPNLPIESLRNATPENTDENVIRELLASIFNSKQMLKSRAVYQRQISITSSHFFVIYAAAKRFGLEVTLDAWLAGKM